MAAIVRNLFVGAGAISGGFAFWVNRKAKDLPEDQKGSIFIRMKEVLDSVYISKMIPDPVQAEHHVGLVASLCSRQFTENLNVDKGILKLPIHSRNNTTNIYHYDSQRPRKELFIFAQKEAHKEAHKEVPVFAGGVPQVENTKARDSILRGNYLICRGGLPKGNVIITGTTDQKICTRLKKTFDFTIESTRGRGMAIRREPPYPFPTSER